MRHNRGVSILVILGLVLFVVVGIVATLGSGQGQYDRIGESWLPPEPAPAEHDPGLAEETRQLVLARNERRARKGQEPLDVEAEVERTLRELSPER